LTARWTDFCAELYMSHEGMPDGSDRTVLDAR
jgi:hypothetical protein